MGNDDIWHTIQQRPRGMPPRAPSQPRRSEPGYPAHHQHRVALPSLPSGRSSPTQTDLAIDTRALQPTKASAADSPDLGPKLWRALSNASPRLRPGLQGGQVASPSHRNISWVSEKYIAAATMVTSAAARPGEAELMGQRQGLSAVHAGTVGAGETMGDRGASRGGAVHGRETRPGRSRRRRATEDSAGCEPRPGSAFSGRSGGSSSPSRPRPGQEAAEATILPDDSPSWPRRRREEEAIGPEPGGAVQCGWAVFLASSRSLQRREGGATGVRLLASAFEGRPPVLFFDYEPRAGAPVRDASRVLAQEEMQAMGFGSGPPPMHFAHDKTKDVHEYNATLNTFRHNGVARTTVGTGKWCVMWSGHTPPETLRTFHPFQKTNHFPASWQLGRKDFLSKNVARMRRQWPKDYIIAPTGFVLPEDHQGWAVAREQNPSALWIWKPCNSSCGRGIRLYSSSVSQSTDRKLQQKAGIVQRYVDRPLLVNGFKFDLRLYVVVTSYDPLKVYLNEDGLVRIATERYASGDNLDHRTMHLTNYSVNKHSEGYVKNSDGRTPSRNSRRRTADSQTVDAERPEEDADVTGALDGAGEEEASDGENAEGPTTGRENTRPADQESPSSSKWSLRQLREYLDEVGLCYEAMMHRIRDLLIKTILAAEPQIANTWHQGANYTSVGVPGTLLGPHQTCFELYGFDVMVDEKLKPWLLEVNIFPSLSSSSPFDKRIKTKLIADTLTLVGLVPFEYELVERAMREEQTKRLQGLAPKLGGVVRSHTIQSLPTADLRDLGEAEWRVILDAHDENMRRGSFERIFPRQETLGQYDRFFSTPRYSNLVLARWLEAGGERCFLPEARSQLPPLVPRQVSFTPC